MLLDLVKQHCYNLLQSNNRDRFVENLEENKSEFRVTIMVFSVTCDLRTMYILLHNVLSLRSNIGCFWKVVALRVYSKHKNVNSKKNPQPFISNHYQLT